jgi:hypothetical protein
MRGVFALQFGLATRSQIVKQLLPRFDARPLQDALELRPKVRVVASIAADDVLRAFGSGLGSLQEVGVKLRE